MTAQQDPPPGPVPAASARFAILGTPRTGNTWVRRVLADVFDAAELAVHHPADLDWGALPDRFVLQLHWPRTRRLVEALRAEAVTVLSLARHPADVILSVLHFAKRGGDCARWLTRAGRDHRDELALVTADEGSPAFLRWIESERAAELLALTPSWWVDPATVRVRYELLLEQPLQEFARVVAARDDSVRVPLERALAENSPARLHELSGGVHVWKATAGQWRDYLSTTVDELIATRHAGVFDTLGYPRPACAPCEPGVSLRSRP